VCSAPDCVGLYKAGQIEASTPEVAGSSPAVAGDSDVAQLDSAPGPQPEERANDGHAPAERSLGELREIAVDDIAPDPDQPRDAVDDELWASIAANGVLQPIVVRPHPDAGKFDAKYHPRPGAETPPFILVDGERRWRGARRADLATIPARVMNAAEDDGDRLLHQVVFNEGKRLTPMEEARSWRRIMTAKGWTAQQLAKALGRGKSTVSDRLALLDAPPVFQALLVDGTLTAASAPIIRQYAHLPADILEKLVHAAEGNYGWHRDVQAGKSVSLATLGASLSNALSYPFTEVEGTGKDYDGATFVVNKKTYAVDRSAYLAHVQAKQDAAASGKRVKAADDYQARQAAENRKRRVAADQERALRRAQFDAISAKLPAVIGRDAALFVIGALAGEMQQLSQIAACKGLSIEMPKKSLYGADHKKLLIAHAEKLDGAGRNRMLLQLAMASDLQVAEYDGGAADLINAAAKLVKLDLKKVKPPVDEKSKVVPAKKSPAKSTPKKKRRSRHG
jgi:ParB/RepB/Spo0J family partition protein